MSPTSYLGFVVTVLACVLLTGCDTSNRAAGNVSVARQIGPDPGNDFEVNMFQVAEQYPGFAGMYNAEDERLTILTTEPDSSNGIVNVILSTFTNMELTDNVEAGVNIVQVEHSYVELYGYWTDLMMAIRGNRFFRMDAINIKNNNIDLGFAEGISEVEIYNIIDNSGVSRDIINIITGITTSGDAIDLRDDGIVPMRAGPAITLLWYNGETKRCTMGPIVQWQEGIFLRNGFLTNSHCSDLPFYSNSDAVYQYTAVAANQVGIENYDAVPLSNWASVTGCASIPLCRRSDASFIITGTAPINGLGSMFYTTGPMSLSVANATTDFYNVGSEYYANIGDDVVKTGSSTGTTFGEVVNIGANFSTTGGVGSVTMRILGSTVTDYVAEGGDSGAAVMSVPASGEFSNNGRKLLGMHWGHFCAPGASCLAYYSPMANIERDLGNFRTYPGGSVL